MAEYSTSADLLIGDITASTDEKVNAVGAARDEIDGVLGFTYVLPLSMSAHVALVLKRCSNLIASGRFILARAATGQAADLHAYGTSLLKEGQSILDAIANGSIDLVGCTKLEFHQEEGTAPKIVQGDASSGVDAYYGWMAGSACTTPGTAPIWSPGS